MTENKPDMDPAWTESDDAPDLTSADWAAALDAVPVKRGRPKSPVRKVATTLRLDPDIVAHFRATGPGWQTRINEALRHAVDLND